MTLRNAAPLVILSWYLLTPPYAGPDKFDSKAPLSAWSEAAEFKSVSECETYRHHVSPDDLARNGQKGHIDEAAEAKLRLLGQCVASDDPRLAGKQN